MLLLPNFVESLDWASCMQRRKNDGVTATLPSFRSPSCYLALATPSCKLRPITVPRAETDVSHQYLYVHHGKIGRSFFEER